MKLAKLPQLHVTLDLTLDISSKLYMRGLVLANDYLLYWYNFFLGCSRLGLRLTRFLLHT